MTKLTNSQNKIFITTNYLFFFGKLLTSLDKRYMCKCTKNGCFLIHAHKKFFFLKIEI